MAAELQANGFNAVPLDWTTISFVAPPTWVGLAPGSTLQATIALQTLGGPPPRSNAPPNVPSVALEEVGLAEEPSPVVLC